MTLPARERASLAAVPDCDVSKTLTKVPVAPDDAPSEKDEPAASVTSAALAGLITTTMTSPLYERVVTRSPGASATTCRTAAPRRSAGQLARSEMNRCAAR